MKIIGSVLCLAFCLFLVSSATAQKKTAVKKFTTSGHFEGIQMTSKESGDYGGTSVYLTQSDTETFALVTTAEGSIFDPVLVTATMSGKDSRTIKFSLPNDNGERKFKGTVSAAALTLNEGGTKSVLKRTCAKTYSNISMGSGGDYGGTEIYITDSGNNWFALVTLAEGLVGAPILVPAVVTGKNYDRIAFTLPGSDRKFTGTVGKTSLTLNESGTKTVLKSKCYR